MVLSISKRTGTTHGNAEAFGSIADCYCELGDLEAAQKFYNQYIDTLVVDEDWRKLVNSIDLTLGRLMKIEKIGNQINHTVYRTVT